MKRRFRLDTVQATTHYNLDQKPLYAQHDRWLNMQATEVVHRIGGRIRQRHSLAEICGYCEDLMKSGDGNQNGGNQDV